MIYLEPRVSAWPERSDSEIADLAPCRQGSLEPLGLQASPAPGVTRSGVSVFHGNLGSRTRADFSAGLGVQVGNGQTIFLHQCSNFTDGFTSGLLLGVLYFPVKCFFLYKQFLK